VKENKRGKMMKIRMEKRERMGKETNKGEQIFQLQ
jgi:hypothetical protein